MVTSAEREALRQEKEAEKQRIREMKEAARVEREMKKQQEVAEREKKRKEREALEAEREMKKQQEVAEREKKRKEREAVEAERELKRREKEARKQQEEDKKKQVEAEKEQRRREKEALEAEKESKRKEREMKRQQEEAEKESKRKEKEAAERKKQMLLQKQANIMSRLFRRKETDTQGESSSPDNDQQPLEITPSVSPEPASADLVSRVDVELRTTCIKTEDELLRNHVLSWQEKWKSRSGEPFRRWGVRTTPKVQVSSELRLQGTGMASSRKIESLANAEPEAPSSSLKRKRAEDEGLDGCKLEDSIVVLDDDPDILSSPPRKKQCGSLRWKLLQFDKSHRPAYYGTVSKVSSTIGPRHPLRKDSSLDYEVDSDEEWEEEDPGESLSDCEDKEEDSEKIDVDSDEDVADGFVVPDGYLSESEGVRMDEPEREVGQCSKEVLVSPDTHETLGSMDQMGRKHHHQMKLLDDVIKHALQRNRPFLVSNLQPGDKCADAENQTERLCFQALRMCVVAPDILISPPALSS